MATELPQDAEQSFVRFGLFKRLLIQMTDAIRDRSERIAQLQRRIAALEQRPALKYCGTWEVGRKYAEGNFTTAGGSIWHANCLTTSRPGTDDTWVLACKHGRDLR